MKKELIYVDDAFWCVMYDKYLNVKGEEYQALPHTIRRTKKASVKAFLDAAKARGSVIDKGITWKKARNQNYHVKLVHVSLKLL